MDSFARAEASCLRCTLWYVSMQRVAQRESWRVKRTEQAKGERIEIHDRRTLSLGRTSQGWQLWKRRREKIEGESEGIISSGRKCVEAFSRTVVGNRGWTPCNRDCTNSMISFLLLEFYFIYPHPHFFESSALLPLLALLPPPSPSHPFPSYFHHLVSGPPLSRPLRRGEKLNRRWRMRR